LKYGNFLSVISCLEYYESTSSNFRRENFHFHPLAKPKPKEKISSIYKIDKNDKKFFRPNRWQKMHTKFLIFHLREPL